jgi:hypothetical protein
LLCRLVDSRRSSESGWTIDLPAHNAQSHEV